MIVWLKEVKITSFILTKESRLMNSWSFFRPTFVKIIKKGAVEQFSPIPYLATFVNCGIWVLYGLPLVHPHSLLVITINGSGLVIETVYLFLFLIYSDRKQRIKVLLIALVELLFLAVLAVLVLTVAHTTKVRSNIVGSIAIVGNIMMYAAPLSVMVCHPFSISVFF